jgi:hypothetical protein
MTTHQTNEIGSETGDQVRAEHRLESLDDIVREIADRRLQAEFPDSISADKSETLVRHSDRIEGPEEFKEAAHKVGLGRTEGVLGWSTDLESPAHVLKGEVPQEIATLMHEDLHRLTHPETLNEMTSSPALRDLYEGVTEYLTEHAASGLHGHPSGECYPEQVEMAKRLAAEVGEPSLRDFFFKHEMAGEVARAIERLRTG